MTETELQPEQLHTLGALRQLLANPAVSALPDSTRVTGFNSCEEDHMTALSHPLLVEDGGQVTLKVSVYT